MHIANLHLFARLSSTFLNVDEKLKLLIADSGIVKAGLPFSIALYKIKRFN